MFNKKGTFFSREKHTSRSYELFILSLKATCISSHLFFSSFRPPCKKTADYTISYYYVRERFLHVMVRQVFRQGLFQYLTPQFSYFWRRPHVSWCSYFIAWTLQRFSPFHKHREILPLLIQLDTDFHSNMASLRSHCSTCLDIWMEMDREPAPVLVESKT